ncbi:sigma factor [Streptomyces naphthomycinicus]|uniref:sigma factor n=1 Tax=Streptomyces naphthomycinicus TaxID=2872625 RepID=UPI003B75B799
MPGSYAGAGDAVQETPARAWRSIDRFEGRSAMRAWVYRIAADVCLDALASGKRRALPMDLPGPGEGGVPPSPPEAATLWVEPWLGDDPEAAAAAGDSARAAAAGT